MVTKNIILITMSLLVFSNSTIHKLGDYGVSVELSEEWMFVKQDPNTFAFVYDCEEEVTFCKNILFKFIPDNNQLTNDQLTQVFLNWIPGQFDEHKIIGIEDETINDREYRAINYEVNTENTDLGSTILITKHNNYFLAIYFTAINESDRTFKKELTEFKDIIKAIQY